MHQKELVNIRSTANKNVDAAQSLAYSVFNQAQSDAYEASSYQDKAGILIKKAKNNTQMAHKALCDTTQKAHKALSDKHGWSFTRLTTLQDRSKKNYTQLEGVKQAVWSQEVKVRRAKKQAIQLKNEADHISAVANHQLVEVGHLTDDVVSLQDALETRTSKMVVLQQKLEISELNCLRRLSKTKVCICVIGFNCIEPGSITNRPSI